jgi:hypothetical protein
MRTSVVGVSLTALAIFRLVICATVARAQERVINPGTATAADALQLLKKARTADMMNSQAYSSDNPSLGHFYRTKVAEIDPLIKRLEHGRPVTIEAIDHALDNHEARELGGEVYPVPSRRSF